MAGPLSRSLRTSGRTLPAGRTVEPDDDEERRPPTPSQRRPGGPRRGRQDDARRAAPVQGRGHPTARTRGRRHRPPRLRARGAEAPRVAEPRGRHVRARRHADLAPRHAGLPGLRRRRHRGLRGGRRRALRDGRLGAASRRAWSRPSRSAAATGTAACFFINKCDRENADPTAALDALRAAFGNKIAPLQLAIGAAESFSGYVDLVHRKAWRWDGSEGGRDPDPRRAGRRGRVAAATSCSRPPPRPTTTS